MERSEAALQALPPHRVSQAADGACVRGQPACAGCLLQWAQNKKWRQKKGFSRARETGAKARCKQEPHDGFPCVRMRSRPEVVDPLG